MKSEWMHYYRNMNETSSPIYGTTENTLFSGLFNWFWSFVENEQEPSSPRSFKRRFCFRVSFIARTALERNKENQATSLQTKEKENWGQDHHFSPPKKKTIMNHLSFKNYITIFTTTSVEQKQLRKKTGSVTWIVSHP